MDEAASSDSELLRRHAAGDGEAFGLLHARYVRLVLGTCRRVTGHSALAEDAAQGVFLLLDEKARSLEGHASLAGWLHQTSRHVANNLVREEGRRSRRERRAFAPEPPEADWSQVEPLIDAALGRLNAGDREALLLRFVQDRSLVQVGEALGVAENTARMRVSRAVERLRDHLRKAGATVSVLALMTMLSTRMADAAALPLTKPSPEVLRAVRRIARFPLVAGVTGVGIVLVLFAVPVGAWIGLSDRGEPPEVNRAYRAAEGVWQGSLEYADDRTGERHAFPTTVRVTREADRLRLVARYEGTTSVDETTISRAPGGYTIQTGGGSSSHLLNGTYKVRAVGDELEFEGRSPVLGADVRFRLDPGTDTLILEEELRRPGDPDYRFRNRFTLKR